jgi:hypothetical protein
MEFKKHLFISYAQLDNEPLTESQQGWITRFHASLTAILSMRIGRKAEIWRDSKLNGSDIFADEILQQFPKTALLVSVLTPRYVESEWCTREVREFCKTAEKFGGLVVDNKSRVLKVIKTPVESEALLPSVMKDTLGYLFYIFDDEHTPIELDPSFGTELAQKYNLKVAKLAWDIAQLIRKLEATGVASEKRPEILLPPKPSVYLAECSYDRREAREAIEAELRLHGYPILPERQLPREEADYVGEVAQLLAQCKLSIHLIGSSYGAVPDGPSQKSVVVLQNELAIQRSKSGGLQRVIWLPEGIKAQHSEQQRFIQALQKDPEAQFNADLIMADLETLKGAVHIALQKLEETEPPTDARATAASAEELVYLICDEKDRAATIPVRKFLKGQGLDVKIPLFEGDAATVRRANQDVLTQCRAVILFYGAGDEAWKRTIESDLKKMKGYCREKALLASYIYLAEPCSADKKELIDLEEPNLINGLEGFSQADMKPFLKALQGV